MGNANGKNGEGSAGVASGDYSHPYANSHQDSEHNNSRPKTTSVPVPVADKAKGSKVSKVGREQGNGISEEVDKAITLIEPQGNSEAAGKYSLQDFEVGRSSSCDMFTETNGCTADEGHWQRLLRKGEDDCAIILSSCAAMFARYLNCCRYLVLVLYVAKRRK